MNDTNSPETSESQQIGLEVFTDVVTGYERFQPLFSRKKGGQPKAFAALRQSLSQEIVDAAITATADFRQTIRRIYYLCSGLGMVPKGEQGEDIVNKALNDARWAGHLKWSRINDGGRYLSTPVVYDNAQDYKKDIISRFKMDAWAGQSTRVILCFEKDTLGEMLASVCREWQVPHVSFHGQSSNTIVHDIAELIEAYDAKSVSRIVCLYLGDWDEAGLIIDGCVFGRETLAATDFDDSNFILQASIDDDGFMPYDDVSTEIKNKYGKLRFMLARFFGTSGDRDIFDWSHVEYRRLGITADDVENPEFDKFKLEAVEVKDDGTKNKAYAAFIEKTGDARTLGIDALTPEQLIERTETAIQGYIDFTVWNARAKEIEAEREKL